MPAVSTRISLSGQPATRETAVSRALLVVCALWCVAWLVHGFRYLEDDAWIHLEFARSFAEGQGFSFNGHVVNGDTSPMWVWLLAATHAVVPRWETAAKVLSAFGCVVGLSGLYVYTRSLTRALPVASSRLAAASVVAVFVASPYFGYWSFSGMEALTAMGLAGFALALVSTRELTPGHFLVCAACGGIAPLLRPEMSFLTLLLGLALLVRLLRMRTTVGAKAGLLAAGLILIAAPFGAWALYAIHTFGAVLPNTNAAKRAPPADSVLLRLASVYSLGFTVAFVGVLLLVVWAVAKGRERSATGQRSALGDLLAELGLGTWLLLGWTAINTFFYIANHTYVQTRYIFVTGPLLTAVVMAAAALRFSRWWRAATVAGILAGVLLSLDATWPLVGNKVKLDADVAELCDYIRSSLPPDAPIAIYSIGEFAFLTRHPLVDTGAITRPGIIPFMWDEKPDRQWAWARREGATYSITTEPAPGAKLVWIKPTPVVGWHLKHGAYASFDSLQMWTLPPGRKDPENMPPPR